MTSEGPLVHLREHAELITGDVRLILSLLTKGGRVLDVGAGRGSFVEEARRLDLDALGLDLQPQAAKVWADRGVPGVLGSGSALPFRSGTFDAVRMKEVLEHVEDPLALVRESRRLLRPGGYFIAHVPTPYSQFYPVANFWDDYTHVRPISKYGLQRLMDDGGMEMQRIRGYMSGRNSIERMLGKLIAVVLPHQYHVLARRPTGD